jgi:hypothetical protein
MAAVTAAEQEQEPVRKPKGGTFQLAEIAEVRMSGGDIPVPGSKAEEIIHAAWNAYRYIRAQAQRGGQESIRFARQGWEVSIEMQEVFHAVWPAGQSPLPLSGENHDEARRILTLWLCTHQNLAVISRGNPDMNVRRATVSARPSRWWVSAEFTGVPEGMRLPETVSGMTGQVLQAAQNTLAGKTGKTAAEPGSDWWCPFDNQCGLGMAVTEKELVTHFVKRHGGRPEGFLFESYMEDARALRGTESDAPAHPEPELPPLPETGRVRHAPPPARPKTAPPQQPPVPSGSVGAQARVFAGEVAQLEQENQSLRQRVSELEGELARARTEQRITVDLSAENADALARRIAVLVKSENELS